MSIKPEFSFISLSASGTTATLYTETIQEERVTISFERNEYKHEVLRKVPESSGVEPQIVTLIYGVPGQITSTGAISTTVRDLTPNDSALLDIYQKLVINRYTLKGNTSLNSDVTTVQGWAAIHKTIDDRFAAHQKYAGGNVSIQELQGLQLENFVYLLNTGLDLSCNSFGSISNCLIRSFQWDGDYDSTVVLKSWSMVLDDVLSIESDTP